MTTRNPIPDAALDDRLFFTGTAGTGKTYNAMGRIERLLKRRNRVVIPDPLGVWWGLRLEAGGKAPSGYNVVIFGGPHGDLPLTENAGALIGETVAGIKESCIIDLSELGTKASERRFMLAFLTTLYKNAVGEPLHVVFDEADMWAPQRLLDKEGESAKLLGMMETIVRRGRVKGFIPWLISQRPAVISKDVLSQADGIVAFKLTSSQDRDAIGDWVQGQADKAQWRDLWATLPTMERGEGLIWIPGRGILDRVQFPQKETFDSSRTPKRGERLAHAELKPLDIGRLKERLGKVEAEAKANDPRALRIENARLRTENEQLRSTAAMASETPDPDALEEAEKRGFERGKKEVGAAADAIIQEARSILAEKLHGMVLPLLDLLKEEMRAARTKPHITKQVAFTPLPPQRHGTPLAGNGHARGSGYAPAPTPRAAVADDGSLTRPQQRVLTSLAFWHGIGHDGPSREQVAAVAGYRPGSGGYNNLLGGLKSAGLIDYPSTGRVALTEAGRAIAAPMGPDDARAMLLSVLSAPQKRLVDAAMGADELSREELAERTEYSAGSGGFNNLIGALNTLTIFTKPGSGKVAMSDWAREVLQ